MPQILHIQNLRLPLALAVLVAASTAASAATLCVNPTGKSTSGCVKTIGAAVAAANPGDVITVYNGTYTESLTITKPLTLVAAPNNKPVINARGLDRGIFVNGMAAAPLAGVANVIIDGFRIEFASFEGILVANATNVTLINNFVTDNNLALVNGTCPGLDVTYETSEQADCGEGVHFMGVDHSTIMKNTIQDNSGGVLITDETAPSTSNLVKDNLVQDNGFACGITMAGHPPASTIPSATGPYGIMHNVIAGNDTNHNGLKLPGAGAGVGIFAPFPGTTNTANVITGNNIHQNGLPGVTMHNHVPGPAINLNDNVIVGNNIWNNAADTADARTTGPTGINLFSKVPVTGTVISGNSFSDENIGVAFNVPAGGTMFVHFNNFNDNTKAVYNIGAGTIDATENWWNCTTGPSKFCGNDLGTGITVIPWLTAPAPFETGTL